MTSKARGALARVPETAGTYAVLLDVTAPRRLPQRLKPSMLPPGRYLYAGSARGPGGIRARVRRHMRRGKRRHWHVDHLVAAGQIVGAWGGPDERECDLVRRLLGVRGVEVPVPGFGSSDCGRCAAHLLTLAPGANLDTALAALPG